MSLHGSTITRAGSDGCNASGGCWLGQSLELKFIYSVKIKNKKMESSKGKPVQQSVQEVVLQLST